MNREQQEMALWREAYRDSHCFLAQERARDADAAVEQFRLRYPAEPTAPKAVWYDEPPFEKDGTTRPCWIAGEPFPCAVYWSGHEWRAYFTGDSHVQRLNGRRVCPIANPPKPKQ